MGKREATVGKKRPNRPTCPQRKTKLELYRELGKAQHDLYWAQQRVKAIKQDIEFADAWEELVIAPSRSNANA